jgi:hypothetical protein
LNNSLASIKDSFFMICSSSSVLFLIMEDNTYEVMCVFS